MTDPDQRPTTDETQPHSPDGADAPASPSGAAAPDREASDSPAPDAAATDASAGGLRADPSRPSDTAWREPPWFPPKERARESRSSPVAIVVGLVMIAVGLYFFVDRTLGVALPRIQWGTIWPIVLIIIGGLVLLRSLNRRT